ncbi:MAG: carbonic anhydrase [Legionellales bacterium]|nr:carbonic anhydrase [Legionellales bacterium]|tara:strand:+ start:1667 stop:2287 length:621 start_codon:yes stop_codon:yes gene_type:complete
MKTLTQTMQQKITPEQAIELLRKGNQRFIDNLSFDRNLLQQVNETASGQYPFATILSCIDSRTTAELIFDQGLGDIFSIRIAGNIVNEDILGSMEFACKIAGSKLIVVLGHTSCGAIQGACEHVEMSHLTTLLNKIQPAVESTAQNYTYEKDKTEFLTHVTEKNVRNSIDTILQKSDTLKTLVETNEIKIVGGIYDIATGKVTFLN